MAWLLCSIIKLTYFQKGKLASIVKIVYECPFSMFDIKTIKKMASLYILAEQEINKLFCVVELSDVCKSSLKSTLLWNKWLHNYIYIYGLG